MVLGDSMKSITRIRSAPTLERWRAFKSKKKRAAELLEFAMITPLLLALSMGIVQYGILLNTKLSLYHTCRNGGRYAAVRALNPGSDSDIKSHVILVGKGFGLKLNESNVGIYYVDSDDNLGNDRIAPENTAANTTNRTQYNPLKIRLTYNTQQKLFLPPRFFGIQFFATTLTVENIFMVE